MLGVVVLRLTHRVSALRVALKPVHVVLAVPAMLGRPAPEPAAAGAAAGAAAHSRAALRSKSRRTCCGRHATTGMPGEHLPINPHGALNLD